MWRSMMVFRDGDMAHTQLRELISEGLKSKTAPLTCYSLVDQEKKVSFEGIEGHVDGILKHDSEKCKDGAHHDMLLEVKSMNDRAFSELEKKKELGYEYRCQVSGYLAATGLEVAVILAKNKNNGDIIELLYRKEPDLLAERTSVVDLILLSQTPEDVQREYGPNTRGNLPWQCGYCPFVELCWRHESVIMKKTFHYQVDLKAINKAIEREEESLGSAT